MSLRAVRYLHIPRNYADALGGLRWSAAGDVLETGVGATFAFAPQVADFLDGLAATRPLPHFAHVLHLMSLFGVCPAVEVPAATAELPLAYALEKPALRNAGALSTELCSGVPAAALQPSAMDLRRELCRPQPTFGLFLAFEPEAPALTPKQFEQYVFAALERLSLEEIRHWLKHGCAPLKDAEERIAEEVAKRPPNLLDALADAARDRERLTGAMALVPTLTGALTLPPRRLDSGALPLGGYADVTTRGAPERLLPSQFAIDGLEFVRRFAEHELLYFRREEPHNPVREELVVLLDQGVRTWGGVRLALAGGLFALARLAERRRLAFSAATTGTGGYSFDPRQSDPAALGARLEASDLTPHPGPALETVLREVGGPRDVVLLTHPRTLLQPEVVAAWQHARPGDRTFAVAVDSDGAGQLCEIRAGQPLPLSRFRVDLTPTAAPAQRPEPCGTWTGDIEPVPFPFWFGPTVKITHMALDNDGEWLLVAAKDGALHAVKLDGSAREVWPRGMYGTNVLRTPREILGVAGGFVVVGRSPRPATQMTFGVIDDGRSAVVTETQPPEETILFHYDLTTRTVRCYELDRPGMLQPVCAYFPDLHSVAVDCCAGFVAVDLATGGVHPPRMTDPALVSRAIAACERAKSLGRTPPWIMFRPGCVWPESATYPRVDFRMIDGRMRVAGVTPSWPDAIPKSDGAPLFAGASVADVEYSGDSLAVSFFPPNQKQKMVGVFRRPAGWLQYLTPVFVDGPDMHLAADGGLIAVHSNHLEVRVLETVPGHPPVATLTAGHELRLRDLMLGNGWLSFVVDKWTYLFQWFAGEWTMNSQRKPDLSWLSRQIPARLYDTLRLAEYGEPAVGVRALDPSRFPRCATARLQAAFDSFGHVTLFNRANRLLVMIRASRGTAEVWLPDGTRWPSTTPDRKAGDRVAAVLRDAEQAPAT